jgi:transposase-like protein
MEKQKQPNDEYESPWGAIVSISAKISCSPETLRRWICQHERNAGRRKGPSTAEQERVKALEREMRELCKANGILRLGSAFVAQAELDRRFRL